MKESYGKANLGVALPMAEEFLAYLLQSDGVIQASIVGSARRGKPQVNDIDILAAVDDYQLVSDKIVSYKAINKVESIEKGRISGRLTYNVSFEVILVNPEDYVHSLVWTTGSLEFREVLFKDHNRADLRHLPDEISLFDQLGIQFIPPELRENRGEIELAKSFSLPTLIEKGDLKGDLHMHSEWSDGSCAIPDMVVACKKMGYSYMAVTDHSKSLHISGGLSEDRLRTQGEMIDNLNQELQDFTVLKGTEVDILKDGSLDFPDEVLCDLDVVVASIHSNFKLDKNKQTERLLKVMKNEHVDIIGHLTGRLLNRRSGYELDLDKILEGAAQNNIIFEINSHPDRLDVDEEIARKSSEYGIKIAINSDAHHTNELKNRKYGVLNARRGWLTANDVVNTWDINKLTKYLKA